MKPIERLIINRVASFIIFLLLVIVLNIMVSYIGFSLFQDIVDFLNNNILFIGLIVLFFVLGEVFGMLKFPFNLPYPLFSAVGALFILYFIFDVFDFLISVSSINIAIPFNLIFFVIAIILFFAILITGYYHIFKNIPEKQVKKKTNEEKQEQEPEKKTKKPVKKVVKKKK